MFKKKDSKTKSYIKKQDKKIAKPKKNEIAINVINLVTNRAYEVVLSNEKTYKDFVNTLMRKQIIPMSNKTLSSLKLINEEVGKVLYQSDFNKKIEKDFMYDDAYINVTYDLEKMPIKAISKEKKHNIIQRQIQE